MAGQGGSGTAGSQGQAGTSGGGRGRRREARAAAPPGDGQRGNRRGHHRARGRDRAGGAAPPVSKYIVVDQFGYLPDGEKIAVIRDPQTGFDASESFTPGATYALVNAATGARVFMAAPSVWNGGATDASSGDKAWWFTFTSVTTPGDYYVLDVDRGVRSYPFQIADQVYRNVLKQAVRMSSTSAPGRPRTRRNAGAGWTDAASFAGALQDQHCRLFSDKNNAATERDLRGGWYDAGDLNKYTSWTAGYVRDAAARLRREPDASGPTTPTSPSRATASPTCSTRRSGASTSWCACRAPNGSVLSIVGEPSASPPSAATGQCLYGPANTSATLATAAAFAAGARVLKLPGNAALEHRRRRSADARDERLDVGGREPGRAVQEQRQPHGSSGLGSGQQETDDYGRLVYKLDAAAQLFAATGDATYRTFFDGNYTQLHLFTYSNYVAPWDVQGQDAALDYADATGATAATVTAIRNAYLAGAKSSGNLGAITGNRDPYLAFMQDYIWGSNSTKSHVGNLFAAVVSHRLEAASNADMTRAASRYVHYIHGTNPLSLVYLTNMYASRRRELRQRDVPHLVRRRQREVGSRRHVDLRPAARLPHGRPQPELRLGRLLPLRLRRHRQQRGLHVDADHAAEGPARAEGVQGLQHRLAAEFVVRHRAERRLPGRVHPPAVEVRALAARLTREARPDSTPRAQAWGKPTRSNPQPPPRPRRSAEEHPPIHTATQPNAACADDGTCAESSRDEVGRCGCRSR